MSRKSLWDLLEEKANQENIAKGVREELALALTTTTGAALIPESLEPFLVELVRRLSPLTGMMTVIEANGTVHEFNQRTVLPTSDYEGESAVSRTANSTYNRGTVTLKITRAKGSVTGFQQAASKKFIDSFVTELSGSAKSIAFGIEFGILWGDTAAQAAANPLALYFSGIDAFATTNRIDQNATLTLSAIDSMIDRVLAAGLVDMSKFVLLMSPQMRSKLSTLQVEARKQVQTIEFAGGLIMESYRGIPILLSSYCRPTSQMGTIVVADSGTAGSLVATNTYRWRVAAVTTFGEQWASEEDSHTLGGGITSVDITFTAVTDARYYKVYRTLTGGAADSEVFSKVQSAFTNDAVGTITGVITSINDGVADASLGADRYLSNDDVDEVMFFLNLDPEDSLEIASLINENGEKVENLVQLLPLARTTDAEDYLLLSYLALVYKGDIFNAYMRRVRA